MNDFWKSYDITALEYGVNYQCYPLYGRIHLTELALSLIFILSAALWDRHSGPKQRRRILVGVTVLLLLDEAALLLGMALTRPAGAAAPLVRDECGVFDADTLTDLEEQAESASDGHDVDVYFLVVDDIGDADQRDYAKNYYISNGLGYGDEQSGILFLLAVGSRKYVTITYGEGVTAFTDYRIEQQEDEIVPELSDEEWADAAYTYIDMCDDALDYYADHGEPIDVDNDIGLEDLLIAMIFPLGISAFICLILYRRMKTARKKTEADEYMPGFTLRVKRDR